MKKSVHSASFGSGKHPGVTRGILLGVSLTVLALLLLATAAQGGNVWNPDGVPICTAYDDQYNPASVSDGAGGAIITWHDYRNSYSGIYAQRVDSSGKTLWAANGVVIRGDLEGDAYMPMIATDGAGGAIITWYDYRINPPQVYTQRVNAQGVVQWTADGVRFAPTDFQQTDPRIVDDGVSGAIITWRDWRDPPGFYAQRVNGAGTPLWGIEGVAVCTVGDCTQWLPAIATDGAHGAIVTWEDRRYGQEDIFAQKIDQAGVPAWTPNGVDVCTAPVRQDWPQIASDSAGGAIITWTDWRFDDSIGVYALSPDGSSDIYAQRISPSGTGLWTAGGIPVCSASEDQLYPQLTVDGSGSAIITWVDYRSARVIYAQKLLASGAVAPGWAADGVAVSTSTIPQWDPMITGDGSGGAIIAWVQGDYKMHADGGRTSTKGYYYVRVYTQQVSSSGKVPAGWDPEGEPVTTVDVPQENPVIVPDGSGGAIVSWEDERESSWDIYAQRVNTPAATWYLAEGSSDWGFGTYITIENPNDGEIQARITYMTPTGALEPRNVALPAMSQTTVDPLADIGYPADFSTKVESLNGLPIGVDRTMTWTGSGAPSSEGHTSVGVNAPNTTWYLPEGSSAWEFETWLLIQNPNANDATCTVTYMIEGGTPAVFTKMVPANSRQTFKMADDIGQQDASIQVVSDISVIAERSMYRNNLREGSDSIGTVQTSTDYYLAEGTTNYGFTTFVLVQNPNPTPCLVSLTYMTPLGPQSQPPFSMPAFSRTTVRVNEALPDSDFSTQVHSDLPIIAERAMYWGADSVQGEAMHDSIGVSEAHSVWYLPDGQSSEGRETYTLVQNPNAIPVEVEVSYLVPGGGTGNVAFRDTIPAQSRRTYSLVGHIPSGRAAILVTSLTDGQKIICERSMYWNGRGAGTCTVGGYAD